MGTQLNISSQTLKEAANFLSFFWFFNHISFIDFFFQFCYFTSLVYTYKTDFISTFLLVLENHCTVQIIFSSLVPRYFFLRYKLISNDLDKKNGKNGYKMYLVHIWFKRKMFCLCLKGHNLTLYFPSHSLT